MRGKCLILSYMESTYSSYMDLSIFFLLSLLSDVSLHVHDLQSRNDTESQKAYVFQSNMM